MKWYFKLNRKIQIAIPFICMIIGFVCLFTGEITFISVGVIFLIISIPFVFLLDRAEKKRKEEKEQTSSNSNLPKHTIPLPNARPPVETYGYTLTGTDGKNGRASRQTIARRIFWKDSEFAFPRPTIVTLSKTENGYDVFANEQMLGSVVADDAVAHITERYSRILLTEIEVDHDKSDRDSPYIPSLSITYYPQNIRDLIPGYVYCPRGQRIRRNKSIQLLDEYVVIDIETTGIGIFSNDIIEVAAAHVRDGKIVNTFSELVYSNRLTAEASAVNHITQDMLNNARKSWDVLNDFSAFIGNLPLLGHNIDFDLSFICAIHPIGNAFEDTCILADEYLSGGFGPLQLQNRKLPTLCNAFGVTVPNAHRALDDAIATHLCYERFKAYYTAVQADRKNGTNTAAALTAINPPAAQAPAAQLSSLWAENSAQNGDETPADLPYSLILAAKDNANILIAKGDRSGIQARIDELSELIGSAKDRESQYRFSIERDALTRYLTEPRDDKTSH